MSGTHNTVKIRKQNAFWDEVDSRLKNVGVVSRARTRTKNQRESAPHVYEVPLGTSNGKISCTSDTVDGVIRVRLYLDNNAADSIYTKLKKERMDIEQEVDCTGMLWNPAPKNRKTWSTRTVGFERSFDLFDRLQWEDGLDWMTTRIVRLFYAFRRRVAGFSASPYSIYVNTKMTCPACGSFEFQQWPSGWDSHAASTCSGLTASDPERRKTEYRKNYAEYF